MRSRFLIFVKRHPTAAESILAWTEGYCANLLHLLFNRFHSMLYHLLFYTNVMQRKQIRIAHCGIHLLNFLTELLCEVRLSSRFPSLSQTENRETKNQQDQNRGKNYE